MCEWEGGCGINASLWEGSGSLEEDRVFKIHHLLSALKENNINVLAYQCNVNGQDIHCSVRDTLKMNALMGELGHACLNGSVCDPECSTILFNIEHIHHGFVSRTTEIA